MASSTGSSPFLPPAMPLLEMKGVPPAGTYKEVPVDVPPDLLLSATQSDSEGGSVGKKPDEYCPSCFALTIVVHRLHHLGREEERKELDGKKKKKRGREGGREGGRGRGKGGREGGWVGGRERERERKREGRERKDSRMEKRMNEKETREGRRIIGGWKEGVGGRGETKKGGSGGRQEKRKGDTTKDGLQGSREIEGEGKVL